MSYKSIWGHDIYEYPDVNGYNSVERSGRVLGWISGGVASAIACKLALEEFGDSVELVFCDTHIENSDTYRFIDDLEKVFQKKILRIHSERFHEPEDVWRKYYGLNFSNGAPCSMVLKQEVRVKYQDLKSDFGHIFGFGVDEKNRAINMAKNHPEINPIFPLIVNGFDKERCFRELDLLGVEMPKTYRHFLNNNCIGEFDSEKGGCVQGGIGYWQKIKKLFPKKYDYMASIEHELSKEKGKPITICKDQRKGRLGNRLFLKLCSDFPDIACIDEIKGRQPVTMFECNGFCGESLFEDF